MKTAAIIAQLFLASILGGLIAGLPVFLTRTYWLPEDMRPALNPELLRPGSVDCMGLIIPPGYQVVWMGTNDPRLFGAGDSLIFGAGDSLQRPGDYITFADCRMQLFIGGEHGREY